MTEESEFEKLRPGLERLFDAIFHEKKWVCIDEDCFKEMREMSKETGIPMSDIISAIIREHLKRIGKKVS